MPNFLQKITKQYYHLSTRKPDIVKEKKDFNQKKEGEENQKEKFFEKAENNK